METLSVAIGLLGVLSTAFLGFIACRLSTTNQQYAARRAIGDLHSEMARMRSEYPAIKSVCACWDDDHRIRMYDGGDSAAQDLFVRYEAHMDIGLEFCNTALGAWARGVIHASDFTRQYRPWFISSSVRTGHSFVIASMVPISLGS